MPFDEDQRVTTMGGRRRARRVRRYSTSIGPEQLRRYVTFGEGRQDRHERLVVHTVASRDFDRCYRRGEVVADSARPGRDLSFRGDRPWGRQMRSYARKHGKKGGIPNRTPPHSRARVGPCLPAHGTGPLGEARRGNPVLRFVPTDVHRVPDVVEPLEHEREVLAECADLIDRYVEVADVPSGDGR